MSTRRSHDLASLETAARLSFPRRPRLNPGVVPRLGAPFGIPAMLSANDEYPARPGANGGPLLAASIARSRCLAVALLVGDRIVVRNERFAALAMARGGLGRWNVSPSVGPGRNERIRAAGLDGLVIVLGGRSARAGVRVDLDLRVARDGDDRVLRLRLEGGGATKARAGMVMAIVEDLSGVALIEAELARAREGLRRRETLLAMGEVAAGVAHDLGNTLGAIQIRTALIARETDLTAAQREHLTWVGNGLRDSLAMLTRVQESLRNGLAKPPQHVDLSAVVRHAIELARTSFAERLSKRVDILAQLPPLPAVWGVASELRQMFVNLLLNARDAMPRGGTIRIRAHASRTRVAVTVEDEGTGVPQAIRQRIFDPFFTTKGENGTGIGLSLARDLMTRIGGRIAVANRPRGTGAIFNLRFQVAEPASSPGAERRRGAARAGETQVAASLIDARAADLPA